MAQHTRVLVLGGMLALLVPMHAHAQGAGTRGYGVEAFGDFGAGNFTNGVRKGLGARDVGAGLGWRPPLGAGRLGVEFRVAHMTHRHVETGKPDFDQLTSWLVGSTAVWHFGTAFRSEGYVLGGLGVIKANASKLCSTCEWNVDASGNRIFKQTGESEHGTEPAYMVGTGFKAAVIQHVAIRGELLLAHAFGATYEARLLDRTVNQSTGAWGWARVTIGAVLHF